MMEISVCIGTACHLKGSYNIIAAFQQMIEESKLNDKVCVKAAFCMGKCENDGVCVKIGDGEAKSVTTTSVKHYFNTHIVPVFSK
jgi:NADH:ubiquinone oxidoreductase subunit E